MSLNIGNEEASTGMSKAIFDKMNEMLSPSLMASIAKNLNELAESILEKANEEAKNIKDEKKAADVLDKAKIEAEEIKATISKKQEDILKEAQKSWKSFSFIIATGVIKHFLKEPSAISEQDFAEIFSSNNEDTKYWQWLNQFFLIFINWSDPKNTKNTIVDLQNRLRKFFDPNQSIIIDKLDEDWVTNKPPTELKGIIR